MSGDKNPLMEGGKQLNEKFKEWMAEVLEEWDDGWMCG